MSLQFLKSILELAVQKNPRNSELLQDRDSNPKISDAPPVKFCADGDTDIDV